MVSKPAKEDHAHRHGHVRPPAKLKRLFGNHASTVAFTAGLSAQYRWAEMSAGAIFSPAMRSSAMRGRNQPADQQRQHYHQTRQDTELTACPSSLAAGFVTELLSLLNQSVFLEMILRLESPSCPATKRQSKCRHVLQSCPTETRITSGIEPDFQKEQKVERFTPLIGRGPMKFDMQIWNSIAQFYLI